MDVFSLFKLGVKTWKWRRGQTLQLKTDPPVKGQIVGNQRKLTHRASDGQQIRPVAQRDRNRGGQRRYLKKTIYLCQKGESVCFNLFLCSNVFLNIFAQFKTKCVREYIFEN